MCFLIGWNAILGFRENVPQGLNGFELCIKIALKPWNIFAKAKDRVATDRKTHAVYSIQCGDCEKEYLGQTKHQFCTSWKEHQRAVSNLYSSKSALAEHVCKTSHKIALEDSKLITTNNRYGQRLCLEAWYMTVALVPLIRMTVAICYKNICILLANDVMLSSI